ncbi:MAG: hypothetical protein LUD14_12055 [Clostridiales bacterium]|nr:hypothetical protein [Clostridiales bacterium]
MQALEAIAKRRSTRDFDPNKPVSSMIVDMIVKAGCHLRFCFRRTNGSFSSGTPCLTEADCWDKKVSVTL